MFFPLSLHEILLAVAMGTLILPNHVACNALRHGVGVVAEWLVLCHNTLFTRNEVLKI